MYICICVCMCIYIYIYIYIYISLSLSIYIYIYICTISVPWYFLYLVRLAPLLSARTSISVQSKMDRRRGPGSRG